MANPASTPVQLTQFSLQDFQTESGVANLNTFFTQLTKTVNASIGAAGTVVQPSGIDVQGATISNVGGIGPQHEVVSKAYAERNYSAAAIGPQLEGNGKYALRTVRRVNDSNQKEKYSTFLEGTLNTAPTTNTSTISGSGDTVTVSAGQHLLVSGNVQSYAARTDTVSLPSSVSIVSASRSSSVVTIVLSSAPGFLPGQVVNIDGVSDSSFDGSFVLSTVVGTQITYAQVASNSTGTGGTASEAGVYYYRLGVNQKTLSVIGPYTSDSQQNRLLANVDGGVLIAVAVFTSAGFNTAQSAAGSTPPPTNSGVHVLSRL